MAKLYFRYGAMNCGKSTAIIQVAYNYEEKGKKVLLMKPSIDTKGQDTINNRSSLSRKVDYLIKNNDKIIDLFTPLANKIAAILIDEAQFLTEAQIDELYQITKIADIPILCYGLRCDFRMQGFEGSPRLLLIADDIEEIKNICSCGKKATQNIRFRNGIPTFKGNQVAIDGDKETYEAFCAGCYFKLREKYDKDFKIESKIKSIRKEQNK